MLQNAQRDSMPAERDSETSHSPIVSSHPKPQEVKKPPQKCDGLSAKWWAHPDSNREPKDYESPAPPLSYGPDTAFAKLQLSILPYFALIAMGILCFGQTTIPHTKIGCTRQPVSMNE